ncbi:MAG: ribonuclease III, partial [Deltaproteobacteria bacterium]|nr:ribonuclease III [Deltaproteobacteria bacterium]
FDAVFRIIDGAFSSLMDFVARPSANHDYKSQIQELVQLKYQKIPDYTVVHESGPDHDKTFHVQLKIEEIQTKGVGKSKKAAEQDAARKGLEILQSDD